MLEIRDEGIGFQPPDRLSAYVTKSKLGIIGMEQRILSIGGEMGVESSPGHGTTIWASIPYAASAQVVERENA